ncbi:uncharacterized protein N7482_005724 [Penicillium canariense]|uniref:Uncharacterized protein n=1 Tax=Penicillium canariense TaxID=189055 RepID=A0A9W9LNQ5_9EURO|nr:uncharacterized protein N7482_005724 [Penicillium canariense]KAJ5166943.1 hypothetical protein N7482_005724 [Penicillium canariense]
MNRFSLRANRGSTPQGVICQLCQFTTSTSRRAIPLARGAANPGSRVPTSNVLQPSRLNSQQQLPCQTSSIRYKSRLASQTLEKPVETESSPAENSNSAHLSDPNGDNEIHEPSLLSLEDLDRMTRDCETTALKLLGSNQVPGNKDVEDALLECEETARSLSPYWDLRDDSSTNGKSNAICSLLEMEEKHGSVTQRHELEEALRGLANRVSHVMTQIIKDEKVFISPTALERYVRAQCVLNQAEHLPEVFNLYANKAIPEEKSSPPKFHEANPNDVNSAVPAELANQAIDVAIKQKNLPLVLAIIDNTFCAPAFHRAKVFKKAAVPLVGLAAAPAACFTLASWASTFQNTMDTSTATGIAFAASLAYVAGTSSMGILAITTANDQMKRVTWLSGVPLRHRWLREEERAALDKVSCAWGFQDPYMHGEEIGEEWDSLREFIGMRGMILDKTELMEGMQ